MCVLGARWLQSSQLILVSFGLYSANSLGSVPKSAEICLIPTPNYKPGKVILAQTIAKDLLAEVASGLEELEFKPKLVGFLANDDMGAKVYAEFSAKTCVQK